MVCTVQYSKQYNIENVFYYLILIKFTNILTNAWIIWSITLELTIDFKIFTLKWTHEHTLFPKSNQSKNVAFRDIDSNACQSCRAYML